VGNTAGQGVESMRDWSRRLQVPHKNWVG